MRPVERATDHAMASDGMESTPERQGISPLPMGRDELTAFVAREIACANSHTVAFETEGN